MLLLCLALLVAPAQARDRVLRQADRALADGAPADAVAQLQDALAEPSRLKGPDVGEARYLLGRGLLALADPAAGGARSALQALAPLETCRQSSPTWMDRCADVLRQASLAVGQEAAGLERAGDRAAALQRRDAVAALWPDSWVLDLVDARMAHVRGDDAARLAHALAGWRRFADGGGPRHPDAVELLHSAALLHAARVDEAEAVAMVAEGRRLLEALPGLDEVARRQLQDRLDAAQAGVVEVHDGIAAVRGPAEAPDASAEALQAWAALQARLDRREDAAATLEAATRRFPDDAALHKALGVHLYTSYLLMKDHERGRPWLERAKAPLERAHALAPDDGAVVGMLVEVTSRTGDHEGWLRYDAVRRELAGEPPR